MLNYGPCYVCGKPINLDLPTHIIIAECEGCGEEEDMFIFCSEEHSDQFVPPTDAEMHEQ